MDILGALDAATDEFGRRLRLVGEETWTLPTPCSDWDVHYLTAHVIGGNRFAVDVLAGMTAPDAIEQVMSSPQLGDNAVAAWTSTCAAQADAFHAGAALRRADEARSRAFPEHWVTLDAHAGRKLPRGAVSDQ